MYFDTYYTFTTITTNILSKMFTIFDRRRETGITSTLYGVHFLKCIRCLSNPSCSAKILPTNCYWQKSSEEKSADEGGYVIDPPRPIQFLEYVRYRLILTCLLNWDTVMLKLCILSSWICLARILMETHAIIPDGVQTLWRLHFNFGRVILNHTV